MDNGLFTWLLNLREWGPGTLFCDSFFKENIRPLYSSYSTPEEDGVDNLAKEQVLVYTRSKSFLLRSVQKPLSKAVNHYCPCFFHRANSS